MAERMTIVVSPSGQDNLTVEDALRQAIDTFDLLSRTKTNRKIVWRLVEAHTNSPPFVVTGEAVDQHAGEQKREFVRAMSQIRDGKVPESWDDPETVAIYMDLMKRVAEQGARIEIRPAPDAPSIEIDARVATYAATLLASLPERGIPRTKDQMGSIDGELISVIRHRDKPALRIKERNTGQEVTCVFSDDALAAEIAHSQTFEDVWQHRRVIARGLIRYGRFGGVLQLVVSNINKVDARDVSVDEIKDATFTDGLPAAEYLKKWREGDLG
jgi:hypothetical protein